jgi:hypothetical protein
MAGYHRDEASSGAECPGLELGRGGAGELAEVTDQVRLVGIAGLGRDQPPVQPPTRLVQAP